MCFLTSERTFENKNIWAENVVGGSDMHAELVFGLSRDGGMAMWVHSVPGKQSPDQLAFCWQELRQSIVGLMTSALVPLLN